MKIRNSIFLVLIFILLLSFHSSFAADHITELQGVKLNRQTLPLDVKPILLNGRTLIPVRNLFESIGATVTWEDSTKKIFAAKDTITMTLQIENNKAIINDKEVVLDVPPKILHGRTLVPIRFVAENFDYHVSMDQDTKIVHINTADYIKQLSRYTVNLKDANGHLYSTYIFSNNEQKTITDEEHAYCAANVGDIVYSGTYQIALGKKEDNKLKVQNVPLFYDDNNKGEFNINRNMVYVLRSSYEGKPDILVVAQYGSPNGDFLRFFFVKNGELKHIKIQMPEWGYEDEIFITQIQCSPSMIIETSSYYHVDGIYLCNTFELDQHSETLLLKNSRIVY